jgi:phosphoglycolate phosphatase
MTSYPQRISLVLFDWDGTLADSVPLVTAATNASLAEVGRAPVTAAEIHDGMRFPTVPRMLFHLGGSADDPEDNRLAKEVAAVFQKKAMELGPEHIHLFDGVQEMLGTLVAAGLPMGVVTNNATDVVSLLIEHLKLESALTLIIGEDLLGAPKPDPEGITRALSHFAVPAERCIYVGDSVTDYEASVAADVVPVGVEWPPHTIVHAENNPYALIAHTPSELTAQVVPRGKQSATP